MNTDRGRVLLGIARHAIDEAFGGLVPPAEDALWLYELGACFVTLILDGELRGCMGSLEAHRSLLEDVRDNARSAAFRDPRFPPLTKEEWARTQVEISLLSPFEAIKFVDENDAVSQLQAGRDGVVIEYQSHRGTFLPQVWQQLPDPLVFFSHLKMKAGLTPDFWAEGIKLYRYRVTKWKESDYD
ncbi:MAG: AmmeMemoRadiSam system protein A [Burkholderiales bacterium]